MLKKRLISLSAIFLALASLAFLGTMVPKTVGEGVSSSLSYLEEPVVTHTITNGHYRLDFSSSNLSFVLTDTTTQATLHSGRRANDDGLASATWQGMLSDGLTIGYRNSGRTVVKPYSTLNGIASVNQEGTTLKIALNLRKISLLLEMDLTLNEDGSLDVLFPYSAISEPKKDEAKEADRYQLASLLPYLGLGDSFGLQQAGSFLFVPDGCGATADLASPSIATAEYDHRIYGQDIGIQGNNGVLREASSNPEKTIKMPVYGLAYSDAPGLMGIVKNGAEYADIYASVSGLKTNYNYAAARFNYREEYYRYVDRAGAGVNDFMSDPYTYDAAIRYQLLPQGASLGDMAARYRSYLLEAKRIKSVYEQQASYRLEWLVSESKATMFGNTELALSDSGSITQALQDLNGALAEKPELAFLGYQKGGWSRSNYNRFDFGGALKQSDYQSFSSLASSLSFDFDYGTIRTSSEGYGDGDIAMTLSNQGNYTFDPLTYASSSSNKDRVMLSLEKSRKKLALDAAALSPINQVTLSVKDLSTTLFSSHYNYVASRSTVASDYAALLAACPLKTNLGMPNEFLLPQARSIIETDLESSAYYLAPNSVPFYQMALSGLYDFYSKPLNLNFENDMKLRLIECNVNPSFLLTGLDSINLYQTASSYLFSSQYSAWADKIVSVSRYVKGALDAVRGEQMLSFERPIPTLSKIGYSNGKSLWVNHASTAYSENGITVSSEGYTIV